MHPRIAQLIERLTIAPSALVLAFCVGYVKADDSGFFGRLFRSGGSGSSPSQGTPSQTLPYGNIGGGTPSAGQPASTSGVQSTTPGSGGEQPGLLTQAPGVAGGPSQRVSPRPRASRAMTTADPLVTRMALGRSNDGGQFAMFLQVFADGTVIDSEGVHHLRAADMKPIVETVQSGELFRRAAIAGRHRQTSLSMCTWLCMSAGSGG